MPDLHHLSTYERHMTLAAMAHCPREYWYLDQIRQGIRPDRPQSDPLKIGLLVHEGLANLWEQRKTADVWTPSVALDVIDKAAGELKPAPAIAVEIKRAILGYTEQWTGVRDHWKPLEVSPLPVPPEPWLVLWGRFMSYPDLIVDAGERYPRIVVDHKTSSYPFQAAKWEYHLELLTQCLAARQRDPETPVFYMIDFLQRPRKGSTVWSFPATPVWEFTEEKVTIAQEWIRDMLVAIDAEAAKHQSEVEKQPWRRSLQCETPWGVCSWHAECFGLTDE